VRWTNTTSLIYSLIHGLCSTTAQLKDYTKLFMMPDAKDSEVDGLLVHYPDDLRAGCPFDTGLKNALGKRSSERAEDEAHSQLIGPQFKRVAAIQGDFVFHGPRRFFLKNRANKQKSWGFSSSFTLRMQ
jgi:acetylcholinesterase